MEIHGDLNPRSPQRGGSLRVVVALAIVFGLVAGFSGSLLALWTVKHFHSPLLYAGQSNGDESFMPTGIDGDNTPNRFEMVADQLDESVVNINTTSQSSDPFAQLFGGGSQVVKGLGTGVIVDTDGYILTNFHVVEHATDIDVFTGPPAVAGYHAVVVQTDWANDLALLRIQTNQTLPSATFGNSDVVNSGDVVFAMGNAYGKGNIFTTGIISDRNQTFSVEGRIYRNMIRTDTYIYPGSSGGALADIHGQIIGINTAIYDPNGNFTGISFATPINRALGLLQSLQAQGPSGMYGPQAMGPASPPNNPGTPFSLAA